MPDTEQEREPVVAPMSAVANALVALHKEQFGRGPTRARAHFAGPDTLVCILQDALLPAEQAMVQMGESQRVQESRMWFQVATSQRFIDVVEGILGRRVFSFASATDPNRAVVMEIFIFHPDGDGGENGSGRVR